MKSAQPKHRCAGFATWNANNLRVYNCLASALLDNITSIITAERMGNGAAVWRALRSQYTPSTPMQVEHLRDELRQVKLKDDESLESYATRVELLAETARGAAPT